VTHNPDEPLIISASRTKDMVRCSPDVLADILLGTSPCRWGPRGPFGQVDPGRVHSVVLWTKDPRNLLDHQRLRDALMELHSRCNILISLQVTVTGLGGSFLEPGIPHWHEVRSSLAELLCEGWINPAGVIYRYDPFLTVRTPAGKIFSNVDVEIFARLSAEFLSLGIQRVTTSRADAVRYPRVAERIRTLGLEWVHIDDKAAAELCRNMADFCHSKGADFSVCCEPNVPGLRDNWGCIDGRWLNRIKGDAFPPATEIPHNRIGKQRPTCQCTYSRDIGYSTGSATCYSGGFGCLYCYAQGNAQLPDIDRILTEIRDFERHPVQYLAEKKLFEQLTKFDESNPCCSG